MTDATCFPRIFVASVSSKKAVADFSDLRISPDGEDLLVLYATDRLPVSTFVMLQVHVALVA